ncbi:hypothetical protein ACS0TY_027091 [Phlomoides rotata]
MNVDGGAAGVLGQMMGRETFRDSFGVFRYYFAMSIRFNANMVSEPPLVSMCQARYEPACSVDSRARPGMSLHVREGIEMKYPTSDKSEKSWRIIRLGLTHYIELGLVLTMSLGLSFTFEAELATTLHAIDIAHKLSWTRLWMECDSTYVVQTLRSKNLIIPWRLISWWHKAWEKMEEQLIVSHIFREGNAVTDRLTKEHVLDVKKWWSIALDFIVPYINRDLHYEFYRFSNMY